MAEADIARGAARVAVGELAAAARAGMPDARLEVHYDVRYRGQSFELEVSGDEQTSAGELRERFEEAHERRYGYRDPEGPVELVNVRVSAVEARARHDAEWTPSGELERRTRTARFDGRDLETTVLRGPALPGERCAGPAVWELPEATAVVPPGWSGSVDDNGTLVLVRT
jgi:N-methylhydantoinase A